MTLDHPLFSFMPYGAPELLRDGRRNLFRATLLGSLIAAAALVLAIGISRAIRIPVPPPRVVVPDAGRFLLPPPELAPRAQRRADAMAVIAPRAGVVVPTADALVREDVTLADQDALGQLSPAEPGDGGMPADIRIEAPPLPGIDDYVYVEELPEAIFEPRPVYPEIAKDAGVEGTVLVRALVERDGRVVDVRAHPKHTVPLLEAAALDAARKWVFKPALANRHPVAVWVAIPFEFRLR